MFLVCVCVCVCVSAVLYLLAHVLQAVGEQRLETNGSLGGRLG